MVAGLASGLYETLQDPIYPFAMAAEAGYQGYLENGMLGVVNAFNPAYHAMTAGYQAAEAWEQGDYHGTGYLGFNSAVHTASTVGGAIGLARGAATAVAPRSGMMSRPRVTGARKLEYWDYDGAEAVYNKIRATDDVAEVARNAGMHQFQIQRIKNHLFHREHILDGGLARFDADPLIANAWRRLQQGNPRSADLQLLMHEYFESHFEGIFKTNYRTAHEAAIRAGRIPGGE